MSEVEEDSTIPSKGEFRDVMGRFASGVTVITTHEDGTDYGAAASAVTSLSDEPPSLLICLNSTSTTAQAILRSGVFVVNVLAEDSTPLAHHFASKSADKFATASFSRGRGRAALLDGSIAHLECSVDEAIRGGTHYVFRGQVQRATAHPGHPLAYFRGAFGRMDTAPDAATLHAVRGYVVGTATDTETPLDLSVLAEELGEDIGSVFRALVALQHDGLVRRSGASFALEAIPEAVLFDYYAARLAIEVGAATETVGNLDTDALAGLRSRMEATLIHVDDDAIVDVPGWVRANADFHQYLVSLARSTILEETYRSLRLPALETRTIREADRGARELVADHEAIVSAYERGDLEAAVQCLREHAERPRALRATPQEAR